MLSTLAAALLLAGAAPTSVQLPPTMQCLKHAYPQHVCGGDASHLLWCDGTRMAWDDGRRQKPPDVALDAPDLQDQVALPYPTGRSGLPPATDPGRVRFEPFFAKMYGGDRRAVRAKTRAVRWSPDPDGGTLRVTTVNGVDHALEAVAAEVAALPPTTRSTVETSSGGFVWRVVRGTNRRSAHSWGIAVDVGVPSADYWRWRPARADGQLRYRNRIPLEVVEIFERHGFIWGGKWYHFDTMHFEYRPELLHPRCAR